MYPNNVDYIAIGYLAYAGENYLYYTDENTPADIGSIYYRVRIIDGCGNSNLYSNEINTLFVSTITDNENALNTIVWNQADGREGEVVSYNLYRSQNEESPLLLYTAGTDEYFYQDNLYDAFEQDGDYCYYIEAVEVNIPYGEFDISRSNEQCTLIDPRVWIPNSFVVDGDTPTFLPVFAYASLNDYKMSIINRWGKVLYETEDVYAGWNGYYNGNPVPQGVYIYVIEVKDGFGKLITETGTVTVFSNR